MCVYRSGPGDTGSEHPKEHTCSPSPGGLEAPQCLLKRRKFGTNEKSVTFHCGKLIAVLVTWDGAGISVVILSFCDVCGSEAEAFSLIQMRKQV